MQAYCEGGPSMRTWKKTAGIFSTLIFLFLTIPFTYSTPEKENNVTALLLIDIQNFYFPGGRRPLENPEQASLNSRKILKSFRERGKRVVHIRHNAKSRAEIHKNVAPVEGEKIISKNHVNSFKDTDLLEYLRSHKIKRLVICGMMTHMCVEAAVRAASDLGFDCILIGDACDTRDLKYGNRVIEAKDVHFSTLSSLDGYYAKIMNTEEYLESLAK
jgi:nicotinamidase-related amidase